MTDTTKKIFSRVLAIGVSAAMISSTFGCGRKVVEFEDYPTAGIEGEENVKEEVSEPAVKLEISDDELFLPEKNTFLETGVYVYNPLVIPEWILDEFKDRPEIIKISKQALFAIDNHEKELVLDEKQELSEQDIIDIYKVVYFSNPVTSIVMVSPTDKKNVFELEYFVGEELAEDDEAVSVIEDFRNYITETINENLSSDMSEKEMAAILYKKLITDIDFEPEGKDYLGGIGSTYVADEIIKVPTDHKLTSGDDLIRLYLFFLSQLHIDSIRVGTASGFFTQDVKDVLGDKTPTAYYWEWTILSLDGEYYNNDIILEKLVFDEKYQGAEGAEPLMSYFAMSDDTRFKSYKVGKSSVFSTNVFDQAQGTAAAVPKCEKDYE